MRKLLISTALAGAFFMAPSAQAVTVLPACSMTDINATPALSSQSCSGFYQGNLLNQASKSTLVPILNGLLGSTTFSVSTFQFGSFTTNSNLNGAKSVDFSALPFSTKLNGMTLIGIHYGAGKGSPSDVAGNTRSDKSDSTAFYYFDAGTNLDKINLNFGASSTLTLFSTGTAGAVPEPATWALMILGFGGIGAAMRRGKAKVRVGYAMV